MVGEAEAALALGYLDENFENVAYGALAVRELEARLS
jgi:hypothetical protein